MAGLKSYVFCGPTLSADEGRSLTAESGLDAVFLPPASQGDIYTAALRRPWAIGIVDGLFERVPSIWHKEILWAMSRGIHVFGSASMGALRAAELATFGMVGVGAVFDALLSGELEDDDEVTVIHQGATGGFRTLSEAMVNIRFSLADAARQGIISESERTTLIATAKGLYYPQRSYSRLLQLAADDGFPPAHRQRLEQWLVTGKIDQKRLDAVAMLRCMTEEALDSPKQVEYTFHTTTMWAELRNQIEQRPLDAEPGSDTLQPDALLEELRLEGAPYLQEREQAMVRQLALELAHRESIEVEPTALGGISEDFRRQRELFEPEDLQLWLRQQRLSEGGFRKLLEDEERLRVIRLRAAANLGMYLRDHLRSSGRYGDLEQRSREKQRVLASRGLDNPGLEDAGIDSEELWLWYFGQLGLAVPTDVEGYARTVDFSGIDDLERAVLRELLFQQESRQKGR